MAKRVQSAEVYQVRVIREGGHPRRLPPCARQDAARHEAQRLAGRGNRTEVWRLRGGRRRRVAAYG